jgi:hypothetical protein
VAVNCPSTAAVTDRESTVTAVDIDVDWVACAVVAAAMIAAASMSGDNLWAKVSRRRRLVTLVMCMWW